MAALKITLGFDGFVDQLARVVRGKSADGTAFFMDEIRELGDYIIRKSDGSFALELKSITTKLGGNMPIMANALKALGFSPDCVGAMGYPNLHPVFDPMTEGCRLYSFADPGITTALEFNNGKIMMGELSSLDDVTWTLVADRLGNERLRALFAPADLIALLNWSELSHATEIWRGVLSLLRDAPRSRRPLIFFDLADFSRKERLAVRAVLQLITAFNAVGSVVLSLNSNEASLAATALDNGAKQDQDWTEKAKALQDLLQIDQLVVRLPSETLLVTSGGVEIAPVVRIQHPRITTGAGDHFNAGFCAGLLWNKTPGECLRLAHATAGFYLAHGESPQKKELENYLTTRHDDFSGI